jgi:bifunctional non-homologous end joining protein LigD
MLPRIKPMRLRQIPKPFDDPDYIFELKHDGLRAQAYIEKKRCKLIFHGSNKLRLFQSLIECLAKLDVQSAILDGEIVCINDNGVSRYNELFSQNINPAFHAFDLVWLNGEDLRQLPLMKRKQRLWKLIQKNDGLRIIYAQHIEEQGVGLFELICRSELEGIVAKRKLGIYKSNCTVWLKIKNPKYSQTEGRHELMTRANSRVPGAIRLHNNVDS